MPINTGELQLACGGPGGTVTASVFYDTASGNVRNVGGAAVRVVNSASTDATAVVTGPGGQELTIAIPPGETTRNAGALNGVGVTSRGNIRISLNGP